MSDTSIAVSTCKSWMTSNTYASVAYGAIQGLVAVIDETEFRSGSDLILTLKKACKELKNEYHESISLDVACNIFIRYVSRLDWEKSADTINKHLRDRAHSFCEAIIHCRDMIYRNVSSFLRDDVNLLVHGNSQVVSSTLIMAAQEGKKFNCFVTEGRPACDGYIIADRLRQAGIPVKIVVDTAVGYLLDKIDMVIVGAEAVDENGGVVNRTGTYQIAVTAKAFNKPVYVMCESYKFMREFIFSQDDLDRICPKHPPLTLFDAPKAENLKDAPVINPAWDYTPHEFITLLFTDIGTLTPSAVSDELFKLYY